MSCLFRLDYRQGGRNLIRPLALFLALAVAAPTLFAQEWDHLNGRDKAHDPTGAWLTTNDGRNFNLITFQNGGTVLQDVQGESAFDPAAVNPPMPPADVQTSPQHGVWQRTGWNTFSATLVAIESAIDASIGASTLFRFDKLQYSGRLSESGDQIDLTLHITFFDGDGKQIEPTEGFTANLKGVRVPLEILPHTANKLPVPHVSPTPTVP
jgi:hypothetical protein